MERLSVEEIKYLKQKMQSNMNVYFYDEVMKVFDELISYRDAEEQGLLLRLDSKDELIEVLASKLLNEQFGACYMCKNPMKNITLDGVHNGCDGECNLSEEHTVDDFIKKIVGELERNKQSRH